MFLEGKKIYLRALEVNDLNASYLAWLNDREVNAHNSHAIFPAGIRDLQRYYDALATDKEKVILAIIDKQTNLHIGNLSLQNINWVYRSAEFAILLGDKSFWKKGIATEAAGLMVDYAFRRLNLHRVYCATSSENKGMQGLAGKLKMQKEGVRRDDIYKEGSYHDIIEYGVLRDEFYSS
jgi:ribosomal-protein-alanine N-acetyltransferase